MINDHHNQFNIGYTAIIYFLRLNLCFYKGEWAYLVINTLKKLKNILNMIQDKCLHSTGLNTGKNDH